MSADSPAADRRRLLFYEAGTAPTTRSVRELGTLVRAGWEITVAHLPTATAAVAALGYGSLVLPPPDGNLMNERLSARLADLDERNRGLTGQINELSERIRAHRAAGLPAADVAAERDRLEGLKVERGSVGAQKRAIQAVRRTPTPLTVGTHFGDLARFEPQWHDAAQVMATHRADVIWCADLNALPPAIWASEAMPGNPPVIFDSHELFTELEYLPPLYREAWRMIAVDFIPRAAVVMSVSDPLTAVLRDEFGAREAVTLANHAMPGVVPSRRLRDVLALGPEVPLAVHVGNVRFARHLSMPAMADLLTGIPRLHLALVGRANPEIADAVRAAMSAAGVGDRLHFVDPVPIEELIGFVGDADIALLLRDGAMGRDNLYAMPNKLFDSLAAGLPVLVPKGTLAAEFVEHERLGRTYGLDVAGALPAAAHELLDDDGTRQRARARQAEFTWTTNEPALLGLVDRVAAAASPAE